MASAAAGGGGLPCTALPSFLCKITEELMRDPVSTADGQTYEREAIEEWFEGHDTSPATNLVLENKRLNPNIALRGAIEEWKETYETHLSMANIDWDSRGSRVESGPKAIGKGGKDVQELSSTRVSEFGCLLDDPTSADVTFVVNNERIPAHKIIPAARSPYFRAILSSGVTEAQGGSDIIIQDISPAGFRALLLYLYTDELAFDDTLLVDVLRKAKELELMRVYTHCERRCQRGLAHTTQCCGLCRRASMRSRGSGGAP
jgi:hypothetical protein